MTVLSHEIEPEAGWLYFRLGRNGSYEAARNSRDQSRLQEARTGDCDGTNAQRGWTKREHRAPDEVVVEWQA
jgi:hypothetical protein